MKALILLLILGTFSVTARHSAEHSHLRSTKRVRYKEIIVRTRYAHYKGVESSTFTGSRYYSFLGVPYATPPIDSLRFKFPQPFYHTSRQWDATYQRNCCLQFHLDSESKWNAKRLVSFKSMEIGDEDCLYLNLYTPQIPTFMNPKLLPVIVWIHGGGFLVGSNEQKKYIPDHFINEGILMVAINYRLSAFVFLDYIGFLSTEDEEMPGNNGLRDQIMALRWIQENVAFFGGNSRKVTVFGQSAGAASIAYLIQSPLAESDLFFAAIMNSGTSLCMWSLSKKKCKYEEFAKLQNLSGRKLLEYSMKAAFQNIVSGNPLHGLRYAPVSEKASPYAVFSGRSYQKLETCNIPNKVPILLGFNSREQDGIVKLFEEVERLTHTLFLTKLKYSQLLRDVIPVDMKLNLQQCEKQDVIKVIKQYYNISHQVPEKGSMDDGFLHYTGDDVFIRPIRSFAKLYSRCRHGRNTYFYEFSFDAHGAGHGDELPYFFTPSKYDSVYMTARRLVKMWSNFAKTGNPTPLVDPVLQNVVWPSMSRRNGLAYLDIGKRLTIKSNPRGVDMAFWDELYKVCGTRPFDTY